MENGFGQLLFKKGLKLPGTAVSNYEKGFLSALKTSQIDIETINREFYPNCKNVSFSFKEMGSFSKEIDLSSHKFQDRRFYEILKKDNIIRQRIIECDIVFFSTYHDWRLFKYIKKINPKIKTILILPDLPNFIINKSSFLHTLSRKISSSCFFTNCKYIDALIPITDFMGQYMKPRIKTFVTIEGVAKAEDIQTYDRNGYLNNIAYSGGLAKKYGIMELIEAFNESGLSNKYKLVICGKGECEKEIISEAEKNRSIIYKGFISRDEVLKLLSSSAYLVLPESPKNEYSKYSFHSKIIEYLGSGTPMISFCYPGMSNDYKNFVLEINGSGEELKKELLESLIKYSSMERNENISFGEKSKEFITERLSPKNVGIKIEKLIERLYE